MGSDPSAALRPGFNGSVFYRSGGGACCPTGSTYGAATAVGHAPDMAPSASLDASGRPRMSWRDDHVLHTISWDGANWIARTT